MGIRTTGKSAGLGASVLAAAMILAPGALADPSSPDVPAPTPGTGNQAAAAAPAGGVPHLSSPDNLPPGTSDTPVPGTDGAGEAYAKEIWNAIREHDITWRQGLVLLAQRPMNPNASPPRGLAAGPAQPTPGAPVAPAEPAPAAEPGPSAPAPAAPAAPATP